jgi:dipeptidyl aminopeptidase/acylaminoacyl peptidase
MMGADGSSLRQLTFGREENHSPAFSPDGGKLLFVSSRGGGSDQLWVMPVDGGEARQLTRFAVDLTDPVWSPDGRWIAVTARVYPECGADSECNESALRTREQSRAKALVTENLLYRHWDSWRGGRYSHLLLVDATSGEVVRDLTPGAHDSPGASLGVSSGYAFAPDGRELCFMSKRTPNPERSTDTNLWVVSLANGEVGEARCLTGENEGWDGDPAYSPDGRFIAFRSQATPGHEADLFRLALFDRLTGMIRYLTDRERFDNWVTAFHWLPDSSLVFEAPAAGAIPLYRLALDDGSIRHVVTDGTINGWQPIADGTSIIYTRSRAAEPFEVYRVPVAGGEPVRLTGFNDDLVAEVDLRPAEQIQVEVGGGRQVQVFVVKPHGFDPGTKYPLILNVHGGPQGHWSDAYRGDWQIYPGKGYVVALPNPTGSTGYGQELVDAISCDWGGRVFRDLMLVTDALERLPYVDADRIGAMGWSYGGYMMAWFAGHTDRYKVLASMMGDYDLRSMYGTTDELWFMEHELCGTPWTSDAYERWSPSRFAGSFKTPTLVIAGLRDYRVPYTQSLHFFTDLQRQGVPSRLAIFEESGHAPGWSDMVLYYRLHVDWFHRWLGGGAPQPEIDSFLAGRSNGTPPNEGPATN